MYKQIKIKLLVLSLLGIMLIVNVKSAQSNVKFNATSPTISGEELIEFVGPGERHTLNWTVVDDDIKSYELQMDNVLVSTKEWNELENKTARSYLIEYDIELDVGEYLFSITVYDYSNLQSTFSTSVKINKGDSSPNFLPINLPTVILSVFVMSLIIRSKRYKFIT